MIANHIQKTFERHRARAQQLARWDLVGPFHFSGVEETNAMKITFSSDVKAQLFFPKALGEPYVESKLGAFSAPGRGIHFWDGNVSALQVDPRERGNREKAWSVDTEVVDRER